MPPHSPRKNRTARRLPDRVHRHRRFGTHRTATPMSPHRMCRALDRLGSFVPGRLVVIEGTGSYGAGLARFLRRAGVAVVEVDRPIVRAGTPRQVRHDRRRRCCARRLVGTSTGRRQAWRWAGGGDPGVDGREAQLPTGTDPDPQHRSCSSSSASGPTPPPSCSSPQATTTALKAPAKAHPSGDVGEGLALVDPYLVAILCTWAGNGGLSEAAPFDVVAVRADLGERVAFGHGKHLWELRRGGRCAGRSDRCARGRAFVRGG
jgi:hypothetical protein